MVENEWWLSFEVQYKPLLILVASQFSFEENIHHYYTIIIMSDMEKYFKVSQKLEIKINIFNEKSYVHFFKVSRKGMKSISLTLEDIVNFSGLLEKSSHEQNKLKIVKKKG